MSIVDQALEIKNEVQEGANTAVRVGGLLESMTQIQPLMGFFDYNHGSGTQNYVTGDLVLINDATGVNTNKVYAPEGVTDVWNSTTNKFDFTDLSLGDTVDIRLDLNFTPSSPNQTVNVFLKLAVGTPGEYTIPFIVDNQIKTAINTRLVRFNGIYMGDSNTRDNPAEFIISSDDPGTVQVNGWYVRIFKKSKTT